MKQTFTGRLAEVTLMREEFEKLRRSVAAGDVDAVIFYRASRSSRSQPEFLAALEELDGHGVAVHFVNNRHGMRRRAMSRLRQTAHNLVKFALSLVGHENSHTVRNRD